MADNKNLKPGWRSWRFDQMATNVNVRIDNPSESGMEHYVGLEHLDSDSLKIRRWGTPDDVEATKLMFKKGDIIFGRRRAYQRKLGVAEFDGICSAHAMVLRAKPDVVLPEFLPFFMQSDLFMNRAVEISVGSLSPTINWKTLAAQEFSIPPIDEQRRLVAALSAAVDMASSIDEAILTAQSLRKSLGIEVFGANTNLRPLADFVAESMYGPRFSNSLYSQSGAVAQLRTTDISDSGLINYSSIPLALLDPTEMGAHLLQSGDLVFSRSGTCGVTAVFASHSYPTVPAAFLIRFRLKSGLNPYFLNSFFHSPIGRQLSTSLARGGVQKNVSASELVKQMIPVPSIREQEDAVDRFREIESVIERLESRRKGLIAMVKLLQERPHRESADV